MQVEQSANESSCVLTGQLMKVIDELVVILDPNERGKMKNFSQQKMEKKEELSQVVSGLVTAIHQPEDIDRVVERVQVMFSSQIPVYWLVGLEVTSLVVEKSKEDSSQLANRLFMQCQLTMFIQEDDFNIQQVTSIDCHSGYLFYKEVITLIAQVVTNWLGIGGGQEAHVALLAKQVITLLANSMDIKWETLEHTLKHRMDKYRQTQNQTVEGCLIYLATTFRLKGARAEELVKTHGGQLLDICQQLTHNENWYIRKGAIEVLEAVVQLSDPVILQAQASQLVDVLRLGNSDANIIARFQATKLVGYFLALAKKHSWQCNEYVQQQLLMTVCFNRHQNAESFKEQSLVIWKNIVGKEGKRLLTLYSKESLAFYIQEGTSSNWEIRECSCRCINELIKVVEDRSLFMPQRDALLAVLAKNMDDVRSSVRNYAFVALKTTLPLMMEGKAPNHFIPRLILHLADQINEVRKDTIFILTQLYANNTHSSSTHACLINAFAYQESIPHNNTIFHSHSNDLLEGMSIFVNSKEELSINQQQREEIFEILYNQFSANILQENVAKVRDSILKQFLEINKYLFNNKQFKKIYQNLYQGLLVFLQLFSVHSTNIFIKDNIKMIVNILGMNQIKAKLGTQGEQQYTNLQQIIKQ